MCLCQPFSEKAKFQGCFCYAIQYARTISKPVFDVRVPVGSSAQDTFKESLIKTKGTFFIDFAIILLPMNISKAFFLSFFSKKENINKKLHVHGNRSVVVVSHAWLIFRKRWYSKKPSNLSISGAWVLTMLVYKDLWMLLFFFGFSKSVLNLWRSNGNQDLVELFSSSTQR